MKVYFYKLIKDDVIIYIAQPTNLIETKKTLLEQNGFSVTNIPDQKTLEQMRKQDNLLVYTNDTEKSIELHKELSTLLRPNNG